MLETHKTDGSHIFLGKCNPLIIGTLCCIKVGNGVHYKLILNALQATYVVAFGESLRFARSQGLDTSKVAAVLVDRSGGVIASIAVAAYPLQNIPLTF